jgi:hypothetical protein
MGCVPSVVLEVPESGINRALQAFSALADGRVTMDNKELIAELDAWPGGLGDQLSAGVVGDIMKRAAQTIAVQDARVAELEAEVERLLAAQEANEFICRSCFRRHDPPREPVAF